jgi:hypothetical protein
MFQKLSDPPRVNIIVMVFIIRGSGGYIVRSGEHAVFVHD